MELEQANEDWARGWVEKFEDFQRDMNNDWEEKRANDTANFINGIADEVKNITETADVTFSLASDYMEPQPASNNSNYYAGAAFGVIALIAGGALVSNCNKKINPNSEPLL